MSLLQTDIPLGVTLGVVLVECMSGIFLVFLRRIHIVFHSDVQAYISTSSE
jgi:hypothetical protein